MVDLAKLENWVNDHPAEAAEPFMNVSTQRKVTIKGVYDELKRQKDTGVAIVDEDLMQVVQEIDEWLKEV